MSRNRIGLVALSALLPATLLLSACGTISEIKKGVDEGVNQAEVCNDSIKLYNDKITKVQAVATEVQKQPSPASVAKMYTSIGAEFTTLHAGLKEQVGKAKTLAVKTALENVDALSAGFATNPKTFDQANGKKLDNAIAALNKACGVADKK